MKPTLKYLILFLLLGAGLGASMYFSAKKLREGSTSTVVVVDGPTVSATPTVAPSHADATGVATSQSPSQSPAAAGNPSSAIDAASTATVSGTSSKLAPETGRGDQKVVKGSLTTPNCAEQPEYRNKRGELGILVNKTSLRRENPQEYLKTIEDFQSKSGLPLPLGLPARHPQAKNVVYNNCKSACHGAVNQVFVTRIVSNRFVEVLLKDGSLKQLPIHESGLEIATIDEVSRKGVPFRSWLAPMTDGPWFVKGNNIYFALDIEGYSLQISSGKTSWKIVATPNDLAELKAVEPLTKAGCTKDEQCLTTSAAEPRTFKAPNVCSPVVTHINDEAAPPKPTPDL